MFGVPSVCGTQAIATSGTGSAVALVSSGGRWSVASLASMSATGPPRRISVARRQAAMNAFVECDVPRELPSRL